MPTVRRRKRVARRGLTRDQYVYLATGVEFNGPPAFESPEHVYRLWHQFRNELMRACRPFERPAMYSEIDLGMTMWSEQQKRTLIELKLPLTPAERAIL